MSSRWYRIVLIGLVLLRVGGVLALWQGLPAELQVWTFHDDYAEGEYVRVAHGLASGAPVASYRGIGFPLLLAPWLWLTGASTPEAIAVPLMLLQGCLLGGLLIVLVADIAWRCTGRRGVAALAAACWALLPLLVYAGLQFRPEAAGLSPYPELVLRVRRLGYLLHMEVGPDGWNLCWVLLGVCGLLRSAQTRGWRWPLLTGAAFGWAGLTMITSVVVAAALLPLLLWKSRVACGRALLAFCCVMSLQMGYEYLTTGSPAPGTLLAKERAELAGNHTASDALWSPVHIPTNVTRVLGKLPVAAGAGLALLAGMAMLGIWLQWRYNAWQGWLLACWIVPHIAAFSAYWGFALNALRYVLPGLPAACMALAVALTWLWEHRPMARAAVA